MPLTESECATVLREIEPFVQRTGDSALINTYRRTRGSRRPPHVQLAAFTQAFEMTLRLSTTQFVDDALQHINKLPHEGPDFEDVWVEYGRFEGDISLFDLIMPTIAEEVYEPISTLRELSMSLDNFDGPNLRGPNL